MSLLARYRALTVTSAPRSTDPNPAVAEAARRARNQGAERERLEWLITSLTRNLPGCAASAAARHLREHPDQALRLLRTPGSLPFPTRPAGERQPDLAPELAHIRHVIVVQMENHSTDNYLGMLGHQVAGRADFDGFSRLDADGRPTVANPDTNGKPHRAFLRTDPVQPTDPVIQTWEASHGAVAGGRMDGFVQASSPAAMAYWDQTTLPWLYSLAEHFPVCDRYFASTLAMTQPNRLFMMAGSSGGLVTTEFPPVTARLPNGHLFEQLDAHGISWADYYTNLPTAALIGKRWAAAREFTNLRGPFIDPRLTVMRLEHRMRHGGLPAVTFVEPDFVRGSEEAPQNIQAGQEFAAGVIGAVMRHEPTWRSSLIILNYDEHGGYFDHVPPPSALAPGDGMPPDVPLYGRYNDHFTQLGVRVPCVVVSPWSRPGHVSHVVFDHSSVLATIARWWNLPALTWRDANANTLDRLLVSEGPPPFLNPPDLQPAPVVPRSRRPGSQPYSHRAVGRVLFGREAGRAGLKVIGNRLRHDPHSLS